MAQPQQQAPVRRAPSRGLIGRSSRTIRTRLLAIAWIPSFTLLLVGVIVAGVFAQRGQDARSFGVTVQKSTVNLSRLLPALEVERQLTVALAITPGPVDTPLASARRQVDQTLPALLAQSAGQADEMAREQGTPASPQAITDLGQLRRLRQAAESGQVTPAEVNSAYGQMLTGAGVLFRSLAGSAPDPELVSGLLGAADLFDVVSARSDAASLREIATREPGLTEAQYQEYVGATGTYRSRITTLAGLGAPAQRQAVTALLRSPAWQQEQQVQTAVLHTPARPDGSYLVTLPIGRGEADAAGARVGEAIDSLFRQQFTTVGSRAEQKGNQQLTRALAIGAALLVLSLVVLLISTRLSRGIIGRLRALRDRTLDLAENQLPGVVERLRRGERVDVEAELRTVDTGEDEIGQVAEAFDKAQRTAVAAAVAEAETRSGTGKVFLNIARRSQVIVHRQLKVLDQAERSQDDPDQLNLLFELDHLSTRARRNAENLIILGGGRPGRQWRRPVPLQQVTRSAIGESERYVRVSTGELPAVPIDGAAVADIVHLLAELVDNATNFSPPTSRVEVRGNLVGRGAVIEIEDQGLGLEPGLRDQMNEMLSDPPDFSIMALSDEPRLGLFVVARLAAQHGIRVTLAEAPYYGGTRAIVLLPNALLATTPGAVEAAPDADPAGAPRPEAVAEPVIDVPAGDPFLARPDPAVPKPTRTGPLPVRTGDPSHRRPSGRRSANAPATSPTGIPAPSSPPAEPPGRAPGNAPSSSPGNVPGSSPGDAPSTAPNPVPSPAPTPAPAPAPSTAGIEAAPAASPSAPGERPALPRRVRQASLVPQLRDDQPPAVPDAAPNTPSTPGGPGSPGDRSDRDAPEHVRNRFASLQRGTREGRAARPTQGDSVDR